MTEPGNTNAYAYASYKSGSGGTTYEIAAESDIVDLATNTRSSTKNYLAVLSQNVTLTNTIDFKNRDFIGVLCEKCKKRTPVR